MRIEDAELFSTVNLASLKMMRLCMVQSNRQSIQEASLVREATSEALQTLQTRRILFLPAVNMTQAWETHRLAWVASMFQVVPVWELLAKQIKPGITQARAATWPAPLQAVQLTPQVSQRQPQHKLILVNRTAQEMQD